MPLPAGAHAMPYLVGYSWFHSPGHRCDALILADCWPSLPSLDGRSPPSLLQSEPLAAVLRFRNGANLPPSLPPLGRQTDAVTVLPRSENGSASWRHHRQLTYKHVTATHQSLSLSSNTSCKDEKKSQG